MEALERVEALERELALREKLRARLRELIEAKAVSRPIGEAETAATMSQAAPLVTTSRARERF